jgi:transcriptional regulator with XRE-family HTH domain
MISAAQSKAARALLGWSQTDLAKRASIAVSTVADFERGQRDPVANNMTAITTAFKSENIQFLSGGAVVGPKLPPPASAVAHSNLRPVRWVDEASLDVWANRIDARAQLPELVRRLVLSRHGYGAEMRFPSGEAIQLHGWDGWTNLRSEEALIPSGPAVWELGVSEQPRRKAERDYLKRTADAGGVAHSETTFVFVTPRGWGTKQEWIREKVAEGHWKDVRVLDAVDLVQLLEGTPAVALWLAKQTARIPKNVRLLEDAWKEWASSTAPQISESLALAGRDEDSAIVHQWLNGPAGSIAIQAESVAEAMAFLYASISEYPAGMHDSISARTLVVASEDAAREVSNVQIPLVIVAAELDSGAASLLVANGHHVYQALGSNIGTPVGSRRLARPGRYQIAQELEAMKVPEDEASRLARDAGQSLTVLRRLMKQSVNLPSPAWAEPSQAKNYLPALLMGAWSEANPLDVSAVEKLASVSYDEFRRILTAGLHLPESPVRNIGSVWKIASPRDAWFRLSPFLTPADLTVFRTVALEVLGAPDPSYGQDQWWSLRADADTHYSEFAKEGLSETIALMGVFGGLQGQPLAFDRTASDIVRQLLKDADPIRWWSLSDHLKELAEASPEAFLSALGDDLNRETPSVLELFKSDDDSFFGRSADFAELLWSLEMLAWSPDYLAKVTATLFKLGEKVDPPKWVNQPSNSLRQIFLPWNPQTHVGLQGRLEVLDTMRARFPNESWNLLLSLYPKSHDTSTPSPTPLWRSFEQPEGDEPITNRSLWQASQKIGSWLVADVGLDPGRWDAILDRFHDFAPELRKDFTASAEELPKQLLSEGDRQQVRACLRRVIHRNRQHHTAHWALPEAELEPLQRVYDGLSRTDPIARNSWLFESHHPPVLNPNSTSWQEREDSARKHRSQALSEVEASAGTAGIYELAAISRVLPGLVGQAIVDSLGNAASEDILGEFVKLDDKVSRGVVFGLVITLAASQGKDWPTELLQRAKAENWPTDSYATVVSALPQTKAFLSGLSELPPDVQNRYWEIVTSIAFRDPDLDLGYVSDQFVTHGRAYQAAELIVDRFQNITSKHIIRVLDGILEQQKASDAPDGGMFQYFVEQLFEQLDQDKDLDFQELGRLEWAYLKALEHSARPPKTLHHHLATSPTFFVDVLSLLYRRSGSDGDELATVTDPEKRRSVFGNAHTLLHSWREVPGSADGKIDFDELKRWVIEARKLCAVADRAKIGDQKIGEILAYAPSDAEDGYWPATPVRRLVEELENDDLETGFYVGTRNKRGVTTRGMFDGGGLERDEASYYRRNAKALRLVWPRTAAILETIAKSYEADARSHDLDVEMRQFR